ncbi:hypothetical protein J5N97_012339 [Dioscorea zingiberensis]|uniref:Uncharacterized protein n=1 Tax=Dioscorea zingiberensis TaxID=325984 RepID=A0A9D5CNW3_9LILI|nr:hypothetical protein J5N97_012339 [Dioscorea zingiberensis]
MGENSLKPKHNRVCDYIIDNKPIVQKLPKSLLSSSFSSSSKPSTYSMPGSWFSKREQKKQVSESKYLSRTNSSSADSCIPSSTRTSLRTWTRYTAKTLLSQQ